MSLSKVFNRVRFGYDNSNNSNYYNKDHPRIVSTIKTTVTPVTRLTDLWVADSPVSFGWTYAILSAILWSSHENEGKIG